LNARTPDVSGVTSAIAPPSTRTGSAASDMPENAMVTTKARRATLVNRCIRVLPDARLHDGPLRTGRKGFRARSARKKWYRCTSACKRSSALAAGVVFGSAAHRVTPEYRLGERTRHLGARLVRVAAQPIVVGHESRGKNANGNADDEVPVD